tara:strand:+ start:5073 stop:5291 length:219 start_codon:yes stop_codon:yes gene_type:complete
MRFAPPSAEELAARGLDPDGNPLKVWINPKKTRARNTDGTLKADDPSTPDVNEAWDDNSATKKRGRPKKKKG